MCNGIGQVMSDITKIAPLGGLSKLIIKGHGASGLQAMGLGSGEVRHANGTKTSAYDKTLDTDARLQHSVLNADYLSKETNRQVLSLITPYFNAKGSVDLFGCHTASGGKGQELLKTLASIWKVPVAASTWYNWKASTTMKGSLVTASADGKIDEKSWYSAERMREMVSDPVASAVIAGREIWDRVMGK
jgi:hypothetical protein